MDRTHIFFCSTHFFQSFIGCSYLLAQLNRFVQQSFIICVQSYKFLF